MFNKILAVILLINMTMSAPEPKPDCYYDQVLGKSVCDNTRLYCNWNSNTFSWECQTERKKREAEPEAREKREASPEAQYYYNYYNDTGDYIDVHLNSSYFYRK